MGTDIKRYLQYQNLHKKVIDLSEQIALWLQRHGAEAQRTEAFAEMEQDLVTSRTELGALNLIPGSPANSMGEDFTIDDDAEIIVYGNIQAGTLLRIGNVTLTLALTQNKRRFAIDKKTNVIVSGSL